jgi:succinate-semialdehyde dehydrogenase/glutarate-semialdehyde dehydrogenase
MTSSASTALKTFEVLNPATGEVLEHVQNMGAVETELAINTANQALPAWSTKTGKERAIILRRWFELMHANSAYLAELMCKEQGKPLHEAKGEVSYAASFLEWFAEEAKRVTGAIPSSTWSD